MNNKCIILFLIFSWILPCHAHAQSKLVSFDQDGKLVYHPYTTKKDILPDFSHCGYMGGGTAIPDVKIVMTVTPSATDRDDTPIIQAAIDKVAQQKINKKGFRGCILLKKGTYRIASPLRITASGIVLRGEGNDKDSGTVLIATNPQTYSAIEIGDKKKRRLSNEQYSITDEYVPSGSRIIHVTGADKHFHIGDDIVIRRPSTTKWIHTIGMDSIAPRPQKGETTLEAFKRFQKEGENTNMNGTVQWKAGSKDLLFERKIVSIKGNKITLDIPLTNALQKEFGGGTICKYTFNERIAQCGVENMYGTSLYNKQIKATHNGMKSKENPVGEYYSDEKHANIFVNFLAVENAWIKNVSVEHFDCCIQTSTGSKFITAQDLSATNPVSIITGGRRYAYSISGGQMCLFQRCYASHHRHQFVLGACVAGPNVFVDGKGDMSFASSEPHQRWSTGCLWDNITLKGPAASLIAGNRGNMGSGHGWAGAQMIFWNCTAPLILVMAPPTAQNFAIGLQVDQTINNEQALKNRKATFNSISKASMVDMDFKNKPIEGNGWIESDTTAVLPLSLYYHQLRDRLGMTVLKNVMTEEQLQKFFPQ